MASQCVDRDGKVIVKQMDLTLKPGQLVEAEGKRYRVLDEPVAKKVNGHLREQWMQVYTVVEAGTANDPAALAQKGVRPALKG